MPKGRVLRVLVPVLEAGGFEASALLSDDRSLVRSLPGLSGGSALRCLLLKPDDVPTYVEYGAADLGVVGRDVLDERGYDVYVPIDLGIGRCRLVVAGKPGASAQRRDGQPLRVATKFPRLAARFFAGRGQAADVVLVQGSVELAPLVGLADVIVDLVESGETLRQNGLEVLEIIDGISSAVIVNRVAMKLRLSQLQPVLDGLRRAVSAQNP